MLVVVLAVRGAGGVGSVVLLALEESAVVLEEDPVGEKRDALLLHPRKIYPDFVES